MTTHGTLSDEQGSRLVSRSAKTPPEGWLANGVAIPIEQQFAALTATLGTAAAADVLQTFLNQANLLLSDLKLSLDTENFNDVLVTLQELANTCTVVGAKSIAFLCSEIEDAVRDGDWNEARLQCVKLVASSKLIRNYVRKNLQSQ
jgi:HPt (histidine-containing phosphotransfer) domain-containing protein